MLSLSKSLAKASRCEIFLQRQGGAKNVASPIRDAGIEYHRFADEYTTHLLGVGLRSDEAWAESWLSAAGVSEKAWEMIERDIPWFEIDPEAVFGVEVFLAVDTEFNPVDIDFPGYGKQPAPPPGVEVLAHGTIDRLEVYDDFETIEALDFKTGFNTKPDDYEALHYATLVFAKFPECLEARVTRRFVRMGVPDDTVAFGRDEYESMQRAVLNEHSRLVEALNSPEPQANPFSGLCGFCTIDCPVRDHFMNHDFPAPPLQDERAARGVVGMLKAAKMNTKNLESILRGWLSNHGPVEDALIEDRESVSWPLADTLRAMNIDCPDVAECGIDLTKLQISGLNELFKRQKWAKQRELLSAARVVKNVPTLKVPS